MFCGGVGDTGWGMVGRKFSVSPAIRAFLSISLKNSIKQLEFAPVKSNYPELRMFTETDEDIKISKKHLSMKGLSC